MSSPNFYTSGWISGYKSWGWTTFITFYWSFSFIAAFLILNRNSCLIDEDISPSTEPDSLYHFSPQAEATAQFNLHTVTYHILHSKNPSAAAIKITSFPPADGQISLAATVRCPLRIIQQTNTTNQMKLILPQTNALGSPPSSVSSRGGSSFKWGGGSPVLGMCNPVQDVNLLNLFLLLLVHCHTPNIFHGCGGFKPHELMPSLQNCDSPYNISMSSSLFHGLAMDNNTTRLPGTGHTSPHGHD